MPLPYSYYAQTGPLGKKDEDTAPFGTQLVRGFTKGLTAGLVKPFEDRGAAGWPETFADMAGMGVGFIPLARGAGLGVAGAAKLLPKLAPKLLQEGVTAEQAGQRMMQVGRMVPKTFAPFGYGATLAGAGAAQVAGEELAEKIHGDEKTVPERLIRLGLSVGAGGLAGKLHRPGQVAADVIDEARRTVPAAADRLGIADQQVYVERYREKIERIREKMRDPSLGDKERAGLKAEYDLQRKYLKDVERQAGVAGFSAAKPVWELANGEIQTGGRPKNAQRLFGKPEGSELPTNPSDMLSSSLHDATGELSYPGIPNPPNQGLGGLIESARLPKPGQGPASGQLDLPLGGGGPGGDVGLQPGLFPPNPQMPLNFNDRMFVPGSGGLPTPPTPPGPSIQGPPPLPGHTGAGPDENIFTKLWGPRPTTPFEKIWPKKPELPSLEGQGPPTAMQHLLDAAKASKQPLPDFVANMSDTQIIQYLTSMGYDFKGPITPQAAKNLLLTTVAAPGLRGGLVAPPPKGIGIAYEANMKPVAKGMEEIANAGQGVRNAGEPPISQAVSQQAQYEVVNPVDLAKKAEAALGRMGIPPGVVPMHLDRAVEALREGKAHELPNREQMLARLVDDIPFGERCI